MSQTIVLRRQTADYDLCIDYVPLSQTDRFYLAHIDVFRWAPSVMRQLQHEWPPFRAKIDAPVFAWNENEDAKWEKFIKRFGFRYFKQFIGPDGLEHKLYLHI